MPRREEDLAFDELFRRTGDAEALGRVFDLVAPRLLIVAHHLTRKAADAEDLVQATFVAAIESAARYDAEQPVTRWLAGILANHARMTRRRAARPLDKGRVHLGAEEPSPDEAAAAVELADEVTRALDELPETYRVVLVLRVVHGLRPIEIAHAIGRSPETVRTQLRRGLELLRKTLPVSLAVPAALVLAEGRGLAAVRGVVVGKAAGAGVPVLATALGVGVGGALMAKKLVAVCALVMVSALVWWSAAASGAGPSVGADEPAAAAPVIADERRETRLASADSQAEARQVVVESPPALAPATALAVLRGRCVAAESGLPLSGCRLTLYGRVASDERLRLHGEADWKDPAPITTGADGRFEVAFDPPRAFRISVYLHPEQRVPISTSWSAWAPGAALDVGDVKLSAGTLVRGRAVDRGGQPVAHVSLITRTPPFPFGLQHGEPSSLHAMSMADGSFELGALTAGEFELQIGSQHALLSPARFTVAADTQVVDLLVRVMRFDELPALSGVVVDEGGQALAGIEVHAQERLPGETRTVGSTRSLANGDFVLRGRVDGSKPVALSLQMSRSAEIADWQPGPSARFAWGDKDVRLVVPRRLSSAGRAVLTVVDWPGGKPLEDFGLFAEPDRTRARDGFSDGWKKELPRARHPGGRVELGDLRPGSWMVIVHPTGERLPPAGPVLFDVKPGGVTAVSVEVRPRTALRVRVLRRDRSPIAGTQVELLHAFGPKPLRQESLVAGLDGPAQVCCPEDLAFLRDKATTDDDGVALLHGPKGARDLTLRVLPIECHGLIHAGVEITGSEEPIELIADSGATLQGRIEPADLIALMSIRESSEPRSQGPGMPVAKVPGGRPAGLVVHSTDQGGARLPRRPEHCFPVGGDGSFRITGVPPGTWQVRLFWWTPPDSMGSTTHWFDPPLATLSVAEGDTKDLVLDARAFRPARLSGRVLVDGKPVPGIRGSLFQLGDSHTLSIGVPPADSEGRFTTPLVMPGRYRFVATLETGATPTRFAAPELLVVVPGESIERTFFLTRQALRIRLMTADGRTPLARRTIRWSFWVGGRGFVGELTTDADGVAVNPVPVFPAELTMREPETPDDEFRRLSKEERDRRTIAIGTVDGAAGEKEVRAEFRLDVGR